MEYQYAFWTLVIVGGLVYALLGSAVLNERKINESHKRAIEILFNEKRALISDKHALMRENDSLQARIDKIRPPFGGLLSELPELFTDEEFATRAQKAEEGRAKGRRLNDRYEGPKPGIDWEEHDETFSKG